MSWPSPHSINSRGFMRLCLDNCKVCTPEVRFIQDFGGDFGPKKAGDVGHDLYADVTNSKKSLLDRVISRVLRKPTIVVWPFTAKTINSGIFLSMPNGIWCKIEARSSTMRKCLSVLGGVIDSGYRGQMLTIIHNFGILPRAIKHNERYAQVIFFDARRPRLTRVGHFDHRDLSDRGTTGFGSTGS